MPDIRPRTGDALRIALAESIADAERRRHRDHHHSDEDDVKTWHECHHRLHEPAIGLLKELLHDHVSQHGCGEGDSTSVLYVGGYAHCPIAKALNDMAPWWANVPIG